MAKQITGWFVILVTFGIIFYDTIIAVFGGPGSTISEVFLAFAWRHPFLPFAWGVLVGHLTWPSSNAKKWRVWRIGGLVAVGVVGLLVDILAPLPEVLPFIPVLVGIGIGHLCWPQADMGV